MRDETFGPVLPVMTFKTEDEAIRLANDSVFGLTASVWTKDIARGRRLAERIEAGTVMVNEVLYTHGIAQTPWGGIKESGYGRTHGRMGLLELVTPRHIHVNRVSFFPDLWWFRYDPGAEENSFRVWQLTSPPVPSSELHACYHRCSDDFFSRECDSNQIIHRLRR